MQTIHSREIESNQIGIHNDLANLVKKHCQTHYLRPIPDFSRAAFAEFEQYFAASDKAGIVLDSCCGTGESTAWLAGSYPSAFVIGIDHSAHRIKKHSALNNSAPEPSNYKVLRAEAEDFWRLLGEKYGAIIEAHTVFYPNPYPKARHVMRRWHGHPLFLPMLRLAAKTELRTNWQIYAEEFLFAASLLGFWGELEEMRVELPVSAFERKYAASGHKIWRVLVRRGE